VFIRSVGGGVSCGRDSDSGSAVSPDQHAYGPGDHGIGARDLDDHVAGSRGRLALDEYGPASRYNGSTNVRLRARGERTDMEVDAGPPCRPALDQHRRPARSWAQRRAMTGHVPDPGGWCAHGRIS
jgi:hypothetical protein